MIYVVFAVNVCSISIESRFFFFFFFNIELGNLELFKYVWVFIFPKLLKCDISDRMERQVLKKKSQNFVFKNIFNFWQ